MCLLFVITLLTALPFAIVNALIYYDFTEDIPDFMNQADTYMSSMDNCLLNDTTVHVMSMAEWLFYDIWLRVGILGWTFLMALFGLFCCGNPKCANIMLNITTVLGIIYFVFQFAWIAFMTYVFKNEVEPNEENGEQCDEKVVPYMYVQIIVGFVSALLLIVLSCLRPSDYILDDDEDAGKGRYDTN